jgi:hypothetical protein
MIVIDDDCVYYVTETKQAYYNWLSENIGRYDESLDQYNVAYASDYLSGDVSDNWKNLRKKFNKLRRLDAERFNQLDRVVHYFGNGWDMYVARYMINLTYVFEIVVDLPDDHQAIMFKLVQSSLKP